MGVEYYGDLVCLDAVFPSLIDHGVDDESGWLLNISGSPHVCVSLWFSF